MKKLLFLFSLGLLLFLGSACSKDNDAGSSNIPAENTLIFKGNQIVFTSLTIDDDAPNGTSEYILTTESNISIIFYCKYIGDSAQLGSIGVVTYTTDAINYFPITNYPNLKVRGYVNYVNSQFLTDSGEIKIKRNDTGNQVIEFVNLQVKEGNEIQTLNGTINLPKS